MNNPTLPPIKEEEFQTQVIQLARLRGWRVYHTHDSRHSAAGFPDLVLVRERDGRLLFAELKSNTGRLTLDQRSWLAALRACGVPAFVWTPEDWPSIEAALM